MDMGCQGKSEYRNRRERVSLGEPKLGQCDPRRTAESPDRGRLADSVGKEQATRNGASRRADWVDSATRVGGRGATNDLFWSA